MNDDPWSSLRRHTPARIALGRAGASLPTSRVLEFALAHAAARDAVHEPLDLDRLDADLRELGIARARVRTRAPDRATYLLRPDLGRALDDASRAALVEAAAARHADPPDVAIVLADGLSAPAAHAHAPHVLAELLPLLARAGLRVGDPMVLATHARVALEDDVGAALAARAALILLGERPGLAAPDSLGAYLVYDPRPGNTDANRNCVSNIHGSGLSPRAAADLIAHLLQSSLRRRLSGVALKDDRPHAPALSVER